MRHAVIVVAAVCCTLLFGCAKPLPPDKAAYAGDWVASRMRVFIGADGSVHYRRTNVDGNAEIRASINEFDGNNLVVGIGPMATELVVTVPPHEEAGVWKMTMDGIELTKR